MLDGLAKYDDYTDGKFDWIGQVPTHWSLYRTKHVFREINERSVGGNEQHLSMSQSLGLVPSHLVSKSLESESYDGAKLVRRGDLVLNRLKAHLAVFSVAPMDGLVSPDYSVFRLRNQDDNVHYFEHLLKTPNYLGELRRRVKGIVEGFYRLYSDDFFIIPLYRPPVSEQIRIVRFLDEKTAEIDAAIAKKRRLIDLLNEQKAILINRAVTKGLNPNAPMKDSGVDWIGEIPAHWDVAKVKGVFDLLDNRRIPLSGEVRGRMTERTYDYYGASGIIDQVDKYIFDETTILIAEDGANLVMRNLPLAIIATGKYWVNNHAHILRPRDGDVHYWANALEAADYRPLISGAAQPKLTKDAIKNVFLPRPPSEEQAVISNWLEEVPKHFLPVEEATKREISTLNEFKQTLIASAVTGQIKI